MVTFHHAEAFGWHILTDRLLPTEHRVIGIQDHPDNRKKALLFLQTLPLFCSFSGPRESGLLCMQPVGSSLEGGVWVAECCSPALSPCAWAEISFSSPALCFSPVAFCRDLWPVTLRVDFRPSLFRRPTCHSGAQVYSTNHISWNPHINKGTGRGRFAASAVHDMSVWKIMKPFSKAYIPQNF